MKRLLLTLLVFVMFTPSLACADICCPAGPKTVHSKDMPCHHPEKKSAEIKFMKDCAQIDLQGAADHSLVKKQPFPAHDLFSPAVTSPVALISAVNIPGIRAPPRRPEGISPLPVYLSTQRLRI